MLMKKNLTLDPKFFSPFPRCLARVAWQSGQAFTSPPHDSFSCFRDVASARLCGKVPVCRSFSDRKRNLQKFENSLFGSTEPSLDVQQVSFFLLDGSMSTLNTGITVPTEMGVTVPAVSPGRSELELDGEAAEALWLASYFRIAATNGLDQTRRLWIDGFYQNLEILAESIHRSIAKRGGEINSIVLEEEAAGQPVVMNVIVPFLFGVPAEKTRLTNGIERGGGIIHSEKLSVLVGMDV